MRIINSIKIIPAIKKDTGNARCKATSFIRLAFKIREIMAQFKVILQSERLMLHLGSFSLQAPHRSDGSKCFAIHVNI